MPDALTRILDAAAFAAGKHRSQRRKDVDATPYINHPLALAQLLSTAGIDDPHVLMAALLHDTVEDTKTTREELAERFGEKVASIVSECTDDKDLDKDVRKSLQVANAAKKSYEARLVKLADKTCNLRDIATSPPADWDVVRKREYFDWAKHVVDQMRGTHEALETIFDAACASKP